jgi:RNA polymerase sigma factor (sigma-70 family)
MEESDRDLMGRMARGDREALSPLMQRHYQRLYRIAHGYLRSSDEALDVVQETFVKAYLNAARWNPASEVGPWLTRIAINQAIDLYRRGRRRTKVETQLDEFDHRRELATRDRPSPDGRLLGREIGERIGAALRLLPDGQRAIFVLRHYEEMSLPEIASTLNVPLGTVKSSLHRAVARMRERLEDLR